MKWFIKPKTSQYEDILERVRWGRLVVTIVGGIFGLIVIFGGFYVVGAGEQAVIFSAVSGVQEETTAPGFHFKTPLIESVTRYEVRSQLYTADAEGASKDLQDVHTQVAVQYHPDAAYVSWIHSNLGPGYASRVIVPAVQEAVKASTAKHEAANLVVQRQAVKDEITNLLTDRLAQSHIVVEQTSLTDFDFSAQFNAAIEAKVTAEQNALAAKNKLEQVKYEAQQKVEEAKGQAEAAKVISQQLEQNPRYIEFLAVQKWDGRLPMVAGNGGVPFINLPGQDTVRLQSVTSAPRTPQDAPSGGGPDTSTMTTPGPTAILGLLAVGVGIVLIRRR